MSTESNPTVTLEIGGGVAEVKCDPQTHVPSDVLLDCIIDICRGEGRFNRCWNLFLNLPTQRRSEFEQKGWHVAGIISNHFGVGVHALKMCLPIAKSPDGRAAGARLRTPDMVLGEVIAGLPGWREPE